MAQLVERSTEKPGAKLTRVRVPGAARDFSPRVNFQCRLSHGVRTAPCVQSHESTSAHTLKIPDIGSHTNALTHENRLTAHAETNNKWVALLLRLLRLTQVRRPEFPVRDKDIL